MSQEYIHASHERTKQGAKPYDCTQFLVHHLQDESLCLVHVHLVDALTHDGADVNALKDLRKMVGDDGSVNGYQRIHSICELDILTGKQVLHRFGKELVGLTPYKVSNDAITVLLQYLVDVLGKKSFNRFTQQFEELVDDAARKEQLGCHAKSTNQSSYLR